MSDDFKVGDVVVCVNAGLIERVLYNAWGEGLVHNAIYRVTGVGEDEDDGAIVVFCLNDIACGRLAERFRKLPPADPEFIQLMRGLKVPSRELVE